MRIERIEPICVSRLHDRSGQWFTDEYRVVKADGFFVRIWTDAGLIGIGEGCAYGVPPWIARRVDAFAADLVGRRVEDIWQTLHTEGASWAMDAAVAALDTALWDLIAQERGVRLSSLMGAGGRDLVETYGSGGCTYDWRARPESLIEEAVAVAAAGHRAFKLRLGTRWAWDGVDVGRFLGLMGDVSAAVGPSLRLIVDGSQRLDYDGALAVARGLERLGFAWFEEPLPQDDIEGNARLARNVGIPISGGEQFTTLEQFAPRLIARAYSIIQPDVGWCGPTEALRIAAAAEAVGIRVVPHSWHNGPMLLANAHFIAAADRPEPLEVNLVQGPLQMGVLADPPPLRDGVLALPDGPGLGAHLRADVGEVFPHIEGHYAIRVERQEAPFGYER